MQGDAFAKANEFSSTIKLDAAVVDYINELKTNYEQQIQNKDRQIIKLNNEVIEYQNKYLEINEKYTLLIYKRFMQSAEKLPEDNNQPLLFTNEAEPEEVIETDEEEKTEVKSYSRKKPGRKPIDPKIERKERIIDIPENEKTCACGSVLTRIGEETSEKLVIIPPQIYVDKIVRPKYAEL